MRTTFVETLAALAADEPRLWLLSGDLGFSVLETFYQRFPDRYVNIGVAEQNMTGIAAGLASCGKIVFTYSIANFPTLRCVEQVRNDVCYHELPVKIVSVGSGFAYGPQGYTHHGLEDLAVMRSLPGMTVVCPADPIETELATRAVLKVPGPCYLRLGKAREPVVHASRPAFELGRAIRVREGRDVTLISTGNLLAHALEAAEALASQDRIQCRVLSMHTLKPLDADAIRTAARETGAIVTVEEHSVVGGLRSAVAEVLAAGPGRGVPFGGFAAADVVRHDVGSQAYLRTLCGDLPALVRAVLSGAADTPAAGQPAPGA